MTIPASRRLEFSEIPVIDLAPLREHKNHRASIDQIYRACSDVGFLYVKNHYPPQSDPDDVNNIGVIPHSYSGVGDALDGADRFNYGEYQTALWRRTFPIAEIP